MSQEINNICIFSNLYPPVVSGSSTQSSSLAIELTKMGKKVIVITAKVDHKSKEYENVNGVHIYRLPCMILPKMEIALKFPWLNFTFTPQNQRYIAEIIKEHKPDILHLHNHMFDLSLSAVHVQRKFGIPLVLTIHTIIKHTQGLYNILLYLADRYLLKKIVIDKADIIISPDYNVLEYIKEAFGIQNSIVIPYGIQIPKRTSDEVVERIRNKYKLKRKRIILSLGHVHRIRDRKELVQAMPMVLEKIPNAVLLIVGAVSTDIPLKTARMLGVDESVILTGAVPHGDIGAFLAIADLEAHWLSQDSPDRTSMGVASLESMGFGMACVSVANEKTYGIDVINNGKNFILVEPHKTAALAKKLIELLENDEQRRKIGENAHKVIKEHFSWDIISKKTIEIYKEAVCRYRKKKNIE